MELKDASWMVLALVMGGIGTAHALGAFEERDRKDAEAYRASVPPACSAVRTENQKLRTALELSAQSRKHLEEALRRERLK